MSAIQSGSQLIRQSQAHLEREAHTLATLPLEQRSLPPGSAAQPSLEQSLLSAAQAPLYAAAGVTVLRRSDAMLGNLLDTQA
ncbi:hypothetical protein FCL40_06925 [Ferrimonas sediminicola]|uniref:Uncharacterized protein n=1 Tax=Ferrimonas sediminicola TaxID=2569538 RepID=A0A4U1BG10_9GAMM|nr:hypothetical protein [Ferrimonas sediminicola]TKB49880.1 hypothetical protein FCL40_06925 [Ferrimonas sediminicola]